MHSVKCGHIRNTPVLGTVESPVDSVFVFHCGLNKD